MSQFHAEQPDMPRLPKQTAPEVPGVGVKRRELPRYKIVLHADNINELMFIVQSVMDLTRFPRAESTHKMWEAQHWGKSVILLTFLERAELYVEQFASRGVTVSIEPA